MAIVLKTIGLILSEFDSLGFRHQFMSYKDYLLNEKYDGEYFNMSKRDAIEALIIELFGGYHPQMTNNPINNSVRNEKFLNKIENILEETYQPWYYVSRYSFIVWYNRKNGIHKDFWKYV